MDDRIRIRKKNDEERLANAYTAFNDSFSKPDKEITFKSDDTRLDRSIALKAICGHLRIDAPDFDPYSANGESYMAEVLRKNGVMQRPCRLPRGWYRNAVGAYLCTLESGRVTAALPDRLGYYYYRDPESGDRVVISKRNESGISGEAFMYYRPLPQKKLTALDLFRFMMGTINQGDIALAVLSALLIVFLGLIIPMSNSLMLQYIIPTHNTWMVLSLSAFLIGSITARYFISILQSLTRSRIAQRMTVYLQSALFSRTLDLPASFFRKHHTGDIYGALSFVEPLCAVWTDLWFSSGIMVLLSGIYILQLRAVTPRMQLPAVWILGLEIAILVLGILGRRKNAGDRMSSQIAAGSLALDLLTGIEQIKVSGAQKRSLARYAETFKRQSDAEYRPPFTVKLQNALLPAINILGMGILFYQAELAGLSGSQFVFFYTAYGLANASVMGMSGLGDRIASIGSIIKMLSPILETEPEILSGGRNMVRLSGKIDLENIEFRYDRNSSPVLNNLTLSVSPGDYIAIVGGSGSGKTTLTRILLGFEKPQAGVVYYDGENLRDLDLALVRQQIGVVLQNGKLFTGNIFTNIAISSPGLTEEEAWEAAEQAGIAEDIRAMPLGMYTIVSDGTGTLSGGQKQRLLIARAIAQKPSLLILDEATSALDNVTQKKVTDALAALHCTRIVIAHRLSTIRNCDRIVVLEKGTIAEEGSYEELMEKNGRFAQLMRYQLMD